MGKDQYFTILGKMMGKLILTICREFGSEGHEIGKELSEKLGINLYDKDLLMIASNAAGIPIEKSAPADEAVVKKFLNHYMPLSDDLINDRLFEAQSNLIKQIAERESCIIVGRLGDYILRDNPDCIKVLIMAPFEDRVKIIMEKHNISYEDAKKLVRKMDTARNTYYNYYSNGNWSHVEGKDIVLNRETFGIQGCVEILESICRKKLAE